MGSCAAPSAKGDDKFITTDYLQQCQSLSYPRISAQTGISKTAIFSLVRRFHQVFTDWPLSG
ncbi:hypothetical protein R0760_26320, partial [Escherichia coli]